MSVYNKLKKYFSEEKEASLSDTPKENKSDNIPNDGVFYDLEKDDSHLKQKTAKQERLEEKEEKRKREQQIAVTKPGRRFKTPEELEKYKNAEKEINKNSKDELDKEVELAREPEIHTEEKNRNEFHIQEANRRPMKIQGIDAEIKDWQKEKRQKMTNSSVDNPVGVQEAGHAGQVRRPNSTPDVKKGIEEGIRK